VRPKTATELSTLTLRPSALRHRIAPETGRGPEQAEQRYPSHTLRALKTPSILESGVNTGTPRAGGLRNTPGG